MQESLSIPGFLNGGNAWESNLINSQQYLNLEKKVTILVRLFTPIIEHPQTKNPANGRDLMILMEYQLLNYFPIFNFELLLY